MKFKKDNPILDAKRPDCTDCKKKLEADMLQKRKREIGFSAWKAEMQIIGSYCFNCTRNGISGTTAWALKKVKPEFQSVDLYEKASCKNCSKFDECASLDIEICVFCEGCWRP